VSGSSSLMNFPVLVSITDPELRPVGSGGKVGKSDGSDIVFTMSDGVTKIAHEIESYNGTAGTVVAWVQVGALSPSTDTLIYLYYGNAGAGDQQNRTGVWDGNYRAVWHLQQDPTAAAPQFTDSTANGLNATADTAVAAWTSGQQVAGQIGGSVNFDRSNGRKITLAATATSGTTTVSVWLRPINSSAGYGAILSQSTSYGLYYRGSINRLSWYGSGGDHLSSTVFTPGNWYYVVATQSAAGVKFYVNGMPDATFAGGNVAFAALNNIGSDPANEEYKGQLDEMRLSDGIERSTDWIATEYQNQSAPSAFYAVGASESHP